MFARFTRSLALLLVLALFATACGGSDSSDDGGDSADADTTTTSVAEPEPDELDEPAASDTDTAGTTDVADESDEAETAEAEPVGFTSGSCEFDAPPGFTVECGWVTVPQHWDDPSDPDTMRLHVATFTSAETPPDADPVVYLEGGPGGDTFGLVNLTFADRFGPIVERHPVVMFTQRGSSLSEIDLECEEVTDLALDLIEKPPIDGDVDERLVALQDCADRLVGEGADLAAYHTTASANDVDAVRDALGYDQWNVLGISYGTRLGQEVVRNHPDGVRALILDSIQPPDPNLGSLAAVGKTFEGALDALFAGCEASAECAADNPNLEERFRGVVAEADAEPFELVAADQLTGETYDAIVDDTRLLSAVFQALYNPQTFAALPEMVEQLENDNTEVLSTLIGLQLTNGPLISAGMYTSVMCHDFLAELTPDSAWDLGETGDPLFDAQFSDLFEAEATQFCDVFDTGSAPESITEPVETDIPTLLLAGAYDPITPPSFATAIEAGFSNGQLAVLPHVGHAAVGDDCGMEIALAFFSDPASQVDQSCIDTSATPNWVPGSLEGIDFEQFEEGLLGIRGVVPEGWDVQGPGTFVRGDTNIAHQTVLLQQGGPIPAAQFIGLLANQLGGEAIPNGSLDVGDRTWDIFDVDASIGNVRVYVFDDSGFTLFAAVLGTEGDLPDIEAHVIPMVLENLSQS